MPITAYESSGGSLVPLEKVRPKTGWQRLPLFEEEKAKRFADLMRQKTEFPPIEVEKAGDEFLVLDGIHRFSASHRCSFTHVPVKVVR